MLLLLATVAVAADKPQPAPTTDVPTVLGIAAATYLSTSLLHEGLGHGGACLASGGSVVGVSTSNAGCDGGNARFVSAGGVLGNGVGALATGLPLVLGANHDGATTYALWLHTIINVQQIGGYLMVGPWLPVGDWGDGGFLTDRPNKLPWRIGLSALGLGITGASIPLAHHLGKPLFGDDVKAGQPRRRLLTLPAYLGGSTLIVTGALLNRAGPEFAVSAAVANFAGTLFLAYLPLLFADPVFVPGTPYGRPPLSIRRKRGWWVAGGAAAIVAVAVLGPGLGRYPRRHPLDPTR